MFHRRGIRKLFPAALVTGVLATALMLPAGAAASASLAGYGYSYGGVLHSGPSVNPATGSLVNIFVVGADNAMWTSNVSSGTFSGWTTLGGVVLQRPGSTFSSATNMEVYARGADSAVWYRQEVAGTWGAWTSLGGVVTAGVDATNFGGNTYLFARGGDSALWYRKRTGTTGTTWGPWTSIGGIITSSPTGIVLGTSLFAFVRGGNNAIWFTSTADGATWAAYNSNGGISDSAVAAASCTVGHTHANVFVVAKDSTLWESHTINSGGTWTAWAAVAPSGSAWTSDLGAVCNTGTITIYGRGLNNAMWTWTGVAGA